VDPRSAPLFAAKFHLDRLRSVGLLPPKLLQFQILPILLTLRGGSLARFLPNLQVLCALSVYIDLQNLAALSDKTITNYLCGVFSAKFSITP